MKKTPIRLGPLMILLLVISIALTTLALLTVTTSRADRALAERFAATRVVFVAVFLIAPGQLHTDALAVFVVFDALVPPGQAVFIVVLSALRLFCPVVVVLVADRIVRFAVLPVGGLLGQPVVLIIAAQLGKVSLAAGFGLHSRVGGRYRGRFRGLIRRTGPALRMVDGGFLYGFRAFRDGGRGLRRLHRQGLRHGFRSLRNSG